ncbi:MAG: hypothetical protein UU23_C0002G0007 [Candidatus Curtissbacteria bacterium GW2011_GWA1_40_9]|uniref:DUF2079 domain-containing protein n=1 Tax=Candidatus Curtissbacteria bacterium GW2011_GWA1_40_9 TaxID=1618408 RepID=A0A0G0W1I5_9BACT|nr:MAG: hypothetical protein UU23_C0002G0007 [Candidatus Curtissbacteria bacterium GW2011_GWA1_40_9]
MLQKKYKFLGVDFDFYIVSTIFLTFTILYSLLSVVRHNHFQSQANDFSIYDQAIWLYNRFNFPYSTINNIFDLGDRFRPIIVLLSPLYWFTKNERVILLFQAVILAAAVFPIWLIARRVLPRILALIIPFLYVSFVGIQSAVAYDFHEMVILPVLLSFLFYFLILDKYFNYFVTLVLCLSVREHVGLLLAPLGIYIYFTKRDLKLAVVTSFLSLLWSVAVISIIMPALGQKMYNSFTGDSSGLGQSIINYVQRPDDLIRNFLLPTEKISTLFWSFFSFGMVPIFYIPLIFTIFSQFSSRFLDVAHPIRWTIYYHYSVELAVLLSVSTVYTAEIILKKFNARYTKTVLFLFLFLCALISNIVLNAPLKNLAKADFWQEKNWMSDTRTILSLIPENASVAGQNNLLPHISHREQLYLLPDVNSADYVVFDLHPGQNNWNFYTQDILI